MRRIPILALSLLLAGPALAAEPSADPVEVASVTFVKGCLGHRGAYSSLHERLQPGRDLYLPRLGPAEARPFLQGREGEAFARFDAGVTLVLLKAEDECLVFVQKASSERLYRQLDKDVRIAVSKVFAVQAGGREAKGPLVSRFIDLSPIGEYREDLVKQFGEKLPSLRIILTTSETANPNLQAIITIGTRQP